MKKITLLLIIITFISCKKEPTLQETVKANIEKELFDSLNDPDSYEFVSMGDIDTIYAKDFYSKRIELLNERVGYLGNDKDVVTKTMKETYEEQILKYQNKLDSIPENEIESITTTFKFRSKNKLGAKILANYYVYLTENLTVEEMDKME